MSHCGTTVIRQGPQERISAIEISYTREGTRGVAREVMPEGSNAPRTVVGGSCRRVAADDGIGQGHGAPKVPNAAAIVGRGIAGDRRVRDNHGTESVEDSATVQCGVSANGAVGDSYRRVGAVDAATASYRAVAAHRATRQGQRARAEDASAASAQVRPAENVVADGRVSQ